MSPTVMSALPWAMAAVAVLALAATGELAARWWIRRRREYFVWPPGVRQRILPDPDVFPELERVVRFDINRAGERGDELPRSAHGLYRVLVAGGSQPEGFLTDQYTSWPGALHQLLRAPECLRRLGASRVHVGCIARAGVGSEALDLILERVLPRYPRLQLIIVLVGATDVIRWMEQGAPRVTAPIRTADVFRCQPEGPFAWKPRQLAAVELLRRARQRYLRPIQVQEHACRWMGEARAMRARARTILDTTPDPEPMLERFECHLRALLRRASAHADRVLLVRQPWFDKRHSPEEATHMWHGGAAQAWREEVTTFYSFEVVARLMALMDARAAAVAVGLGVQQLDLRPLLESSLVNYYDGFHPTPAGARIVTHAVAAAVLRESGLFIEAASAAVESAFAAGNDGDLSPGEREAPLLRDERARSSEC